jgi:hypothetical protein
MKLLNVVEYNMLRPIECLNVHLREMSLDNYSGSTHDIGFVTFFLVYTKVLEVIRIGVNYKKNKKRWDKQPKQLHMDNKASSEAKLEFWTYVGRFGISILQVLKTTCMTCQWLIHLMIHNCSHVRNYAREGWPSTLVAIFIVVTKVYIVRAQPMMFHDYFMLHARPTSEKLLFSFAIFYNIVIHRSYLKT